MHFFCCVSEQKVIDCHRFFRVHKGKGVCVVLCRVLLCVRVLIFGWVFPSQDFFIYMVPIRFLDSIAQLFNFLFNFLSNIRSPPTICALD